MAIITIDEVKKHNQSGNGWFIINNDVYDVSQFYDDHPGGRDLLLAHIGADATEAFEAVNHSKSALRKLGELKVGTLPECERRKFISVSEVAKKNNADGAWMIINNKVYDVTSFLDNHPGGRDVLLYNAGGDATQAFTDNGHSDMAYNMMKDFCIGDIEPSGRRKPMERKSLVTAPSTTKKEAAPLMLRLLDQLPLFLYAALFIVAAYYILF